MRNMSIKNDDKLANNIMLCKRRNNEEKNRNTILIPRQS